MDFLAVGFAARRVAWLMLIERRPIGSALHPVASRSMRWAVLAALALSLGLLLGLRFTRGHWTMVPGGRSFVDYVAAAVSIILLAVGEEIAFRGVLLSVWCGAAGHFGAPI